MLALSSAGGDGLLDDESLSEDPVSSSLMLRVGLGSPFGAALALVDTVGAGGNLNPGAGGDGTVLCTGTCLILGGGFLATGFLS